MTKATKTTKSNRPTIASLTEELEAAKAAIEDLELDNVMLQQEHEEQLMDAGLLERETLLSKIQAHEEACRKFITQVIADCEKVTGRPLPNPTNPGKGLSPESPKTYADLGTTMHEYMAKELSRVCGCDCIKSDR